MIRAGDLTERVRFEKRSTSSDGGGGVTTGFAPQFVVWGKFTHLRGGETVLAARLAGVHSLVVLVRRSSQTEAVDTAWRLVDVRTGKIYNIRDITPTADRQGLELLCESGVAA